MNKNQTSRLAALCVAFAGLHAGTGWAATYYQENFDSYADDNAVKAAGWGIIDGSPTAESDWTITNPGARLAPLGGGGKFMVADDDAGSPDGPDVNEELISPAINLTAATTVWLHFATFSEPNDDGDTSNNVDVSTDGGLNWTTVWSSVSPAVGTASTFDTDGTTIIDGTSDGRSTPVHVNISTLAAGKAAVKLRFHHLNATDDWYWTVDNIVVDDAPPFAGGADVLLANEGFEGDTFPPTGWEVIRLSPLPDQNNPWTRDDTGGFRNANGVSGRNFINRLGPDHFAIMDSDLNPDADPEDEVLRTPIIDASQYAKLWLSLDSEMKFNIGKTVAEIEVSPDGGTSWSTLYKYDYLASPTFYRSGEVYYDNFVLDASVAAGSSTVTFRFRYRGNGDEWFWGIDNVKVTGTKGTVVLQQPPAKPTFTAPTTVGFFDTNVTFTGSAFSDPNAGDTLASTTWQFSLSPDFNDVSGFTNVALQVTQTGSSTSLSRALGFVMPGDTVYATVQYVDATGLKSKFADVKSFTVGALPTPFVFENFESTEPFTIPTGWTVNNDSDGADDPDPASLTSGTYKNWVVIPYDTLNGFGGGRGDKPVPTSPADGQSLYAESDNRSGVQIQNAYTPDYNATGKSNVWVVFKSNYVQNQDNIDGLEYSVDKGTNWLPVLYLIDNPDIIRLPDGSPDAAATLTKEYTNAGDVPHPSVTNELGEVSRAPVGHYGDFVMARPFSALGPYLSGRVNDDKAESKRIERFRLPAADNAATVRFRFFQAGTGSWWWGVDDLGLYEATIAAAGEVRLTIGTVTANTLTLNWTGGSGKFLVQKKADLNSATWMNVLTTTDHTATVAIDGGSGFFRVQSDYTGADVIPLTAYLSGDGEPTAVNTTANGVGTLSLQGNTLNYIVQYANLSSTPTGAHIHAPFDSQASGGVAVPFTTPTTTSGVVQGTATLTDPIRDALLNGKGYVNIHSQNNGGGEIRGQILRTRYTATLNGANERPTPVSPAGTGTATVDVLGREIKYNVTFTGLTSNATAAHIHGRADETTFASVLQGFSGVPSATSGTISGTVVVNRATLNAIVDGLSYVNLHTVNNGGGEIRGSTLR